MASVYWPWILAAQEQAHVELRPTVLGRWLCAQGEEAVFLERRANRGEHARTSQTNAGSQLMQNRSLVNPFRFFLEELVR